MPQSLNFARILRLEHDVPAVDFGAGPENFPRHLDVVADAGRAPHVVGGVLIAGVVDGELPGHHRPGVGQVRQLRLVELLEDIGLDLALQEIGGGNDDVIAGFARKQARLQRLVGVERIVDHLDAGFLREILEHPRRHIVRPVVEIDGALGGLRVCRQRRQQCGDRDGTSPSGAAQLAHLRTSYRRCTASDRRSSAVSRVLSFLAKQNRTTEVTASRS